MFTRGPLQNGKSTRFRATPRGGNSRVPSKKLGFATRSRAPMNVTRPKPTRRKLHHPSKKPLHSKGNAQVSGDRMRSSSPVSSTKLLNHPKKKPAMKKNTKKKKIMDGSAQRNSSLSNRHQTQKKHKSGESWESNEAKPAKKRYHFLSGPTSNQRPNSTHRTSWLHGVIDPASESFSNKGDIRFYRGRVAKKKPKRLRVPQKPGQPSVGADTYYGEAPERNASPEDASNNRGRGGAQQQARNRTSSERSSELKKKAQRKWKTAEDAVRRPGHRIKSSKEYTKKVGIFMCSQTVSQQLSLLRDSRSREVDKLPPGVRFSPRMKLSNIRTSVEPMSTKSHQPTPASSQLKPTTLNALSTPVQNGSPVNADSSMDGDDVLGEQSRKTFHANIYHSASLGPIPRRSTIGPMIGVA
ncbi:unnamed protein product [Anisakis simplex]|uniref:Nkap_C domain-containing protein n=1 Tax=Anisakis simplex TaxID=6269 RepID=A0A0M3KF90_ANISI|nr:unnamed protein product [Anisakis simplex]